MPLLQTSRLTLRAMTLDDAPALCSILGDAETMRWYRRPYTPIEVQQAIERQIERYRAGAGLLAVVITETGELIGDCGLVWQEVEGRLEPEIGYHVHRAHWNRGFATEAARAVRSYAFEQLDCDHVISLIRPENLPSRRVAEKNGLRLDRITCWHGFDHCVYAMSREVA